MSLVAPPDRLKEEEALRLALLRQQQQETRAAIYKRVQKAHTGGQRFLERMERLGVRP